MYNASNVRHIYLVELDGYKASGQGILGNESQTYQKVVINVQPLRNSYANNDIVN